MFRWTGIVAAVVVLGLVKAPAPAHACTEQECGTPTCWSPDVKVRPTMTRAVAIPCQRAIRARVLEAPDHTAISDLTVDYTGLHFTATTAGDAPRWEEARFEIDGLERSVEVRAAFEAIPLSVNHAPICHGDTASRRSDGTDRRTVFLHPWCQDEDGDAFVVTGSGPGEHVDAPVRVPAGEGVDDWSYRPATRSGTETTTIAATDALNARSEDATLTVTLGPDVDSPPQCRPNPSYSWAGEAFPVSTRPGVLRHFPIICEDADRDPFTPLVTTAPTHGVLAPLVPDPVANGYSDQWYEATYIPMEIERDPFSVTATGTRGAGPEARMEMVPRADDYNGGGACGWSPLSTPPGVPSVVRISCQDDEGDSITANLVEDGAHGTAGPIVATPARYDGTTISVPYVPDPGYEGPDCIKVVLDDGHGLRWSMLVDIRVEVPPVLSVPDLPLPVPPLPPLPVPARVSTPNRPAATAEQIAAQVRAFAQGVLGTRAVRRTKVLPDVEAWTPRTLSRAALRKTGRAPGMLVLCAAGCQVRSSTGSRGNRREAELVAAPGQPQLLWASATRAQLRRARRVPLRVAIRRASVRRTVRRSLRLR